MKAPITSADIIKVLAARHKSDLTFEELRLSSGFSLQSRVDFWAISPSPSNGNLATAYEIKVSRSDFKRDSHKKQRGARLFSDRFWYAAPAGVIPHGDVPDWAGLLEVDWQTTKYNPRSFLAAKEIISAPKLDKESPSWGLVCSMIRNSRK